MKANKLKGIKDRTARGRLQGGNPTTDDGVFQLYHFALDDLETLIAEVEAHGVEPDEPVADEEPKKASGKKG